MKPVPSTWGSRLLWMLGLWAGSVSVLLLMSLLLRWVLKA